MATPPGFRMPNVEGKMKTKGSVAWVESIAMCMV